MKNKILKIMVVLVCIMTLTMTNFITVAFGLISYAAEEVSTNHPNVEFEAYFKDQEGRKTSNLNTSINSTQNFLYLQVKVKKEGYFNGKISLTDSNFTLQETNSPYVSKIENNTVYLNQINVGAEEEISIKIKPMKKEIFEIGLLNVTSKVEIEGIYRDRTEKDISVKANRSLKLQYEGNLTTENVVNTMKIITNKIVKIEGQEKRILQFSYDMGLKENNYPIQEIDSQIILPELEGKQVDVSMSEYLNNMNSFNYEQEEGRIDLTLKNELTENGTIMWKEQGNENIIITCLYDKDTDLKETTIQAKEKVILYNSQEIEIENKIVVGEEIDSIIEISASNLEDSIYKGKINANIPRAYVSTTQLKVNEAKAIENISIQETNSNYFINDTQSKANVAYQQTVVNKKQFDDLFGENGQITIYNQDAEEVGAIDSATPMNDQGNIVVSYAGKYVTALEIKMTEPMQDGVLVFEHTKLIQPNGDISQVEAKLQNQIIANYNVGHTDSYSDGTEKQTQTQLSLKNSKIEAKIEMNKESLSTAIANDVEIKATLLSNNEKYNLYENPEILITLPEQVENVTINSVDLLYEEELTVQDYKVNGRTLVVHLAGKQTSYKEEVIEGAVIVINATIKINKKSASQEEAISMACTNINGEQATASKNVKIVAPKSMTLIQSIPGLAVETIGQEESTQVFIPRGKDAKTLENQIEVINNHEEAIENIQILGDLPTNRETNNMGIELTQKINLLGIENAKVYYTENEEATEELNKEENGWKEEITNLNNAKKYLIVINRLEAQTSVQGSYTFAIPANLEYNQTAKLGYQVKYIDSVTHVEDELSATAIEMQTGIGPKVETKLLATVAGKEIDRPVKNGEVIHYKIEVSNTGTEDISDVRVTGSVPDGTTMVAPEEGYEYTGASYYQELDSRTYENQIKTLKVGEVASCEYEVRVNNQTKEGTTLENTTTVTYGDVTKSNKVANTTRKV